ncbi:MOSC domain-containing protein [Thiomicrorhabdus sp. 6S3-12]|uniref:MOSC domain-containing protein n=1 Tax=Thiomicrorhabdus sp. 6S3-12 TaxID=2819681 RepID=UPI001AADF229|nr:MOSC domain-containing protein [Thiomicrorhabdus sp. 6S3-12]MBO1924949.1 MOSC domain-containing protein [Thiomicrorhabdus sp. 6S3-12]
MPKLLAIATHQQSRGPITLHQHAFVNTENGLGDHQGNKRASTSLTILSRDAWQQACADAGAEIDWQERRANLLADHIDFSAEDIGRRLQIGESVICRITRETDPCPRMDELAPGLKAALTPDWRGGARCEVLQAGEIQCGDDIRWLD